MLVFYEKELDYESWFYLTTAVQHIQRTRGRKGGVGAGAAGVYCVRMERTGDATGGENEKDVTNDNII